MLAGTCGPWAEPSLSCNCAQKVWGWDCQERPEQSACTHKKGEQELIAFLEGLCVFSPARCCQAQVSAALLRPWQLQSIHTNEAQKLLWGCGWRSSCVLCFLFPSTEVYPCLFGFIFWIWDCFWSTALRGPVVTWQGMDWVSDGYFSSPSGAALCLPCCGCCLLCVPTKHMDKAEFVKLRLFLLLLLKQEIVHEVDCIGSVLVVLGSVPTHEVLSSSQISQI